MMKSLKKLKKYIKMSNKNLRKTNGYTFFRCQHFPVYFLMYNNNYHYYYQNY